MSAPAPPVGELARDCPLCEAAAGQPCRKSDGSVFERVHVQRTADPLAPPTGVAVRMRWDGRERRDWTESQIRADERQAVATRVSAWVGARLTDLNGGERAVVDQLLDVIATLR